MSKYSVSAYYTNNGNLAEHKARAFPSPANAEKLQPSPSNFVNNRFRNTKRNGMDTLKSFFNQQQALRKLPVAKSPRVLRQVPATRNVSRSTVSGSHFSAPAYHPSTQESASKPTEASKHISQTRSSDAPVISEWDNQNNALSTDPKMPETTPSDANNLRKKLEAAFEDLMCIKSSDQIAKIKHYLADTESAIAATSLPGTRDGNEMDEKAREVEALRRKVQVSEAVVRKLHQRNLQLERDLLSTRQELRNSQTGRADAASSADHLTEAGTLESWPPESSSSLLPSHYLHPSASADEEGSAASVRPGGSGDPRRVAHLDRRVQLLLQTTPLPQEALAVIAELQESIRAEAASRALEQAAYQSKLYAAHHKSCDSFVEQRLVEHQLGVLQRQLAERDTLTQQIRTYVHALFQKLECLDQENRHLSSRVAAFESQRAAAEPSGPVR